jgi:hypothetical protein
VIGQISLEKRDGIIHIYFQSYSPIRHGTELQSLSAPGTDKVVITAGRMCYFSDKAKADEASTFSILVVCVCVVFFFFFFFFLLVGKSLSWYFFVVFFFFFTDLPRRKLAAQGNQLPGIIPRLIRSQRQFTDCGCPEAGSNYKLAAQEGRRGKAKYRQVTVDRSTGYTIYQ